MKNDINNFKDMVKNKKVAIAGVGISNIPAIEYIKSMGAEVFALDKNNNLLEENESLKKLDVKYILGENYLSNLTDYDYILRSPGIKPMSKEIVSAINAGVIVTSEIELLIEYTKAKVIGITGSDGKTTTTTLIANFLEAAGEKVYLGGNIGTPLFNKVEEMTENDYLVIELSSFQLMTLKKSPMISVITNISENHLDYHTDYNEYIEAKENIFRYKGKNSGGKQDNLLILNLDNKYTSRFEECVDKNNIPTNIKYFSIEKEVEAGVCLLDNEIVYINDKGEKIHIVKKEDIKLVGLHNIANICAAISSVIDIIGIDPIKLVVTTFRGVEHRMEPVRTLNNITWYNDSIGTSPARTIAGLNSFEDKVILIAGGYDKMLDYTELGKIIAKKVKYLILMGATALKIKKATENMNNEMSIYLVATMEEAIELAKYLAIKNDNIVLSPASASFGMYKNFEQRGNHFKRLVNNLK